MATLEEIQKDLAEVKELLGLVKRERPRRLLQTEQARLETECQTLQVKKSSLSSSDESKHSSQSHVPGTFTVKLTSYGWDQSENFVKIYASLQGVQKISAENVIVEFKERSVNLLVTNLAGKNHSLNIIDLLHPIDPARSSKKVKADMVLVLCRKKQISTWQYLTSAEHKAQDKPTPKYDDTVDPGEGLMDMMRKLYEEGDDDMKRTISKAWVESRDKQARGEF
uniref:calcyclin-binding protein n=1 Tax=Myxine glutinosa TaxID=7769 RepID=UPI00358DDD45